MLNIEDCIYALMCTQWVNCSQVWNLAYAKNRKPNLFYVRVPSLENFDHYAIIRKKQTLMSTMIYILFTYLQPTDCLDLHHIHCSGKTHVHL